jgi:isoleucyl-tRNA synthetase
MEEFVDRHLSNWYVRLSRRRFWKEGQGNDKQAAFEVLHTCLSTVSQLMAPIAPFFADWLFKHLNPQASSVHLTEWPKQEANRVSGDLNVKMEMAQRITSLVMSIRKKTNIRVRQPLNQCSSRLLMVHLLMQSKNC